MPLTFPLPYFRTFHLFLILVLVILAWTAMKAGPSMLEGYLVQERPLEDADAIVVMAGNREQRLPDAARLYHEGAAPKILLANDGVFAGWSREYQRNLYLVEWAREDLVDMGVPWEDIILLEFSASGSIHDVLNTRDYVLSRENIRSLLVVTSDYHTRRTLWLFQWIFAGEDMTIGIYPSAEHPDIQTSRTETLVIELVKYFYYRLRYGLHQP